MTSWKFRRRCFYGLARRRAVPYGRAESVKILPGKGAEGDIDGRRFWIGSHRLMEEKGAETPEFHQLASEMEDAGHSLVAVGNDDHICGLLGVADGIRDGTAAVLDELRELGVPELVMLTGDNEGTARAVAEATGLQGLPGRAPATGEGGGGGRPARELRKRGDGRRRRQRRPCPGRRTLRGRWRVPGDLRD